MSSHNMSDTFRDPASPVRLVSGALAASLEILSFVLGLFFVGAIGLQVDESQMTVAWASWFGCVLVSVVGSVTAVLRGSLGWLLVTAAIPVASSLLLAQVFLHLSATP